MTTSSTGQPLPARKKLFCILLFIVAILADQLIKYSVLHTIPSEGLYPGSFFNIHVYMNSGIAFGIPIPGLIMSVFFVALLITFLFTVQHFARKHIFAFCLLFSGAIGNIIDRVWHGAVVDYVEIWILPVFNIADIFIFVSITVLLYRYYHTSSRKDPVLDSKRL